MTQPLAPVVTILQYWFAGDYTTGYGRRIHCALRPNGRWSWVYESTDDTPDQCGFFHAPSENSALHDGLHWYYDQDFDGKEADYYRALNQRHIDHIIHTHPDWAERINRARATVTERPVTLFDLVEFDSRRDV